MTTYPAITLSFDNVGVSRGAHTLFDGLSFEIGSNQVIWIQGTNGIGKTTLLRLAAGLSRPDQGHIGWTRNGQNATAKDIAAFQGHKNPLKANLSALEDLSFWSDFYEFEGDIHSVLDRVKLSHRKHVKCGHLSAGQGRRLAIARLLICRKPLWIMDEPAAAMDSEGQALILSVVNAHITSGGAALIASHDIARNFAGRTQLLTMEAA